ncbi:MATE efflux family protein [Novosphingobium nitrogenifigens DSM 19370]|uniref:MATE efflux family protein n=1 Tax=Novosphingobium nitrogenifigens DSM 19370 TaxID=983920 RepID=F1Z588_9SPHN|nr:MATE family efflux transporter [Novosphingobium nitrogenifigens]EGD60266.1 MATE efflux family protein [Novosphingobium nitrogenifigens DSM 19370]
MFENPPRSWTDEWRQTFVLAAPLVGANLLQMAVFAVDVVFVARLGSSALAASSLAVSLFGLLIWSLTGLVGAASPLIAAELGRRAHAVREVRRTVRMAAWVGVIASFAAMAVCLAIGPILAMTGQSERIIVLAVPFMSVLMWATIPAVLGSLLRTAIATLGRPMVGTVITGLSVGVNALGNWVFVFGHFGMPALGLNGSALSSVVTSTATLGAYLLVIRFDRRLHRYHMLGRWWRVDWTRFVDVLRIGVPIAATIVAEAGLFNAAAFLMGRIGELPLAAHALAMQFAAIAFQVPFGVAQAATIRVGRAYGAGDRHGITLAGRVALVLGIGFMALSAGVLLFAPRTIIGLYIDPALPANAALVALAVRFMGVAAAFQLFDGAQTVGAALLRGLQDTRVPMALALFGYWVPGLGAAVWLGLYTPLAGLGVWIGLLIGLAVVAALMIRRWYRRETLGLVSRTDAKESASLPS